MASLIVGGVTIPIAPGGNRPREDGVDRARAFDGTMRATQQGTPKRNWNFTTKPAVRATADSYEAALTVVGAQTCSGDILGASISCLSEVTDWKPIKQGGTAYLVSIDFVLHEA